VAGCHEGGQLGVSVICSKEGGPRPANAIHDDMGKAYVTLHGSGRIDIGDTLVDTAYAVICADPEGVPPLLELGSPEYEAQFKE